VARVVQGRPGPRRHGFDTARRLTVARALTKEAVQQAFEADFAPEGGPDWVVRKNTDERVAVDSPGFDAGAGLGRASVNLAVTDYPAPVR
jgi:hypothetical protein